MKGDIVVSRALTTEIAESVDREITKEENCIAIIVPTPGESFIFATDTFQTSLQSI